MNSSPRNPLIALFSHIVAPGLGYFYNGNFKKGIIVSLSLTFLLNFILRVSGICSTFQILVFVLISMIVLQIYLIIDSYREAKKLQDYELKKYNKWYFYLGFIAISWSILEYLPKFTSTLGIGTQFFNIPIASMEPTIKIGDKIVVDYSSNFEEIKNGDLITYFPDASEAQPWISRLVGKEGDVLTIKDNFLIINGQPSKVEKIREFKSNEIMDEVLTEFYETLPNGKRITILKSSISDTLTSNIPDIIIPKDSVLVISDNRDKSTDSRYLGFIHKNRVNGKILYTWWGQKMDRIGIDLTKK